MNSTYKRLGDYIRTVDVRNRDLSVDNLLGLSIAKEFIPSIANTIGTDMSTYKVVSPRQFGYGPVTSRNGDKITIAFYTGSNKAIISQAYTVFEVTDESQMVPEYLMLWFKRPEFDRYARFKSHGSAREVFDWDEMCDVMLPVPPIEEQRRIVAEYQAIEQRIENNRQLITKLEQTAQTIYRKMFVDDIDPENLPSGWRIGTLDEVSTLRVGGDKPSNFSIVKSNNFVVPIYANGLVDEGVCGYTDKAVIKDPAVTISARGTIGKCFMRLIPYYPIVRLVSVIPFNPEHIYYLYFHLQSMNLQGDGSVQSQLTVPFLLTERIIIPSETSVQLFSKYCKPIYDAIATTQREITALAKLQGLLQTKLSKN
jgi:type I restriction enzyme S subunit